MGDKRIQRRAESALAVRQLHYELLSVEERASGRFYVDDNAPMNLIAGATLLARRDGFNGTSITPFVNEYRELEKRHQS
jgi:hypothetical protein